MSFIVQVTGSTTTANAAIAAAQAAPNNSAEAAFLARIYTAIQTEVNNMGAANQVQVYVQGSHTEKTCSLEFQIDKCTPFAGQPIQLSNASPAN